MDGLLFWNRKGTEALSHPFRLEAQLLSTDAHVDLYRGNLGGGGLLAAVKEKLDAKVSLFGLVITKAEAYSGAVDASAGAAAYFDKTDYSVTLKVNGRSAVLLGLAGKVDLKVVIKLIHDLIIGKKG